MKARRTHIKTRTGCRRCRFRRVKCDESRPQCLRCVRLGVTCDGYAASPDVVAGPSSEAEISFSVPGILEPSPTLYSPLLSPDSTREEQYLEAHYNHVMHELEINQAGLFSFGTSVLPEVARIALSVNYVRDGMYGLASTHLALLTKSSSMIFTTYKYRDRALRGLRQALTNPNEHTMDAMLAASLLLSWQAPESNEYLQTMKGVAMALQEMEQRRQFSELRALWQRPAIDVNFPTPPTHPVATSLPFVCTSLKDLQKQVGTDPELVRGVKELYNFVQNIGIAPPGHTVAEQLEALYPIRFWLPWLPQGIFRLSKRDPLLMLFCAHHNMVALATAPYLPAASTPFAMAKRVEFILRVDAVLNASMERVVSGSSPSEESRKQERFHSLMFGPLVLAREYSNSNPPAFWPV